MRAKAGLHWMTSVVPSSCTRLTSMPTSAEVNIRSKSSRAAASSRVARSRSVTSSETPPRPTTTPSASRIGNFSDHTWRGVSVRASGTISSKLTATPPRMTLRSFASSCSKTSALKASAIGRPSSSSGRLPMIPQVSALAMIQR